MLEDHDIGRITDVLAVLKTDSETAIPWDALPILSDLGAHGLALTIDLRATAALGAPLLLVRAAQRRPPFWGSLSKRERDVALCIGRGLSNKEIGRDLGISTATVKDHVHHVLQKGSCASRSALAAKLIEGQ